MSLQNISKSVALTQNNLSTGLKVNSAIDNPSSYYTTKSLTNRANDLNALLDSMGQAISTIQAATTTLEAGSRFLEQATAVATQILTDCAASDKTTAYYESQGYTAVTSDTDIQKLLDSGVKKFVLDGNISLTSGLTITQQDIVIEGNGNRITFGGTNSSTVKAAIKVDGGSVDIKNLYMTISGKNNFGIQAINSGVVTIDNTDGIEVFEGAKEIANSEVPVLSDGKNDTKYMKENVKITSEYEAFYVATSHLVSDDEGNVIDSGDWYLGSAGELWQVYDNKVDINTALVNAGGSVLSNSRYWASSGYSNENSWFINMNSGELNREGKNASMCVRSFQLLEKFVTTGNGANAPKVSDIMYKNKAGEFAWTDKNGTAPAGYTAIGIVTDVSATGDVTIMSLRDLEDPTPDKANDTQMSWGPLVETGLPLLSAYSWRESIYNSGTIKSSFTAFSYTNEKAVEGSVQFKEIINQYDSLIRDGSYKGVNLLSNENLNVRFNEDNSSSLEVSGKNMSAASLGITTLDWETMSDVVEALKEISSVLGAIRSFQTELGNNFSIISTRQDFTENLINVLTEGSDKLTLADMNEESANMLALQTRQQLAVNSLSLASQATQSILKVF